MADKLVTLQDENKTPIYPESRASVVKTSDGKTVEAALAEKQPIGSYLTTESDPTVPLWAKEPTKPSYTAKEVGAIAVGGLKTVNGNSLEGSGDIVIESGGTQYLDLSIFSADSGTLSEEDYQKVVKAYEDKVNIAFLDISIYPLSIQKSDNVYMLGISFASDDEMGHNFLTLSSILIVEKNYTQTSSVLSVIINGSGTKALTDNGQYAEFAKPVKFERVFSGSQATKQLSPNKFYKFEEGPGSLTITLAAEESGILNEYMFEFATGSTPTTLSVPDTVKWSGGSAPTIEANKTYQVSIVNNLAVYASF